MRANPNMRNFRGYYVFSVRVTGQEPVLTDDAQG